MPGILAQSAPVPARSGVVGTAVANAERRMRALKVVIALGSALLVCMAFDFDVVRALFGGERTLFGMIVTSLVAAGGSAGAVAVFHGFVALGVEARDQQEARQGDTAGAQIRSEKGWARNDR